MKITAREWIDNLRESNTSLGLNSVAKNKHSSEDWNQKDSVIQGTISLMKRCIPDLENDDFGETGTNNQEIVDPETGEVVGYGMFLYWRVKGFIDTMSYSKMLRSIDKYSTSDIILYVVFLFDGSNKFFFVSCENSINKSLSSDIKRTYLNLCPKEATIVKTLREKEFNSVQDFYKLYIRTVFDDYTKGSKNILPFQNGSYLSWWTCSDDSLEENFNKVYRTFLDNIDLMKTQIRQIEFLNKNFKSI